MSLLQQRVNRLKEIKQSITELYIEKQQIDKELLEQLENNKEDINLLDNDIDYEFLIQNVYDRRIDYEKMENLYPEIYVLGLETTFSKKRLSQLIDKELAQKIINECTVINHSKKTKLIRRIKKIDRSDKE